MFRKETKKGFTLIEMLAVIAIVAVLVSIIIPLMNGSTDKAGAATNAANLRSVEGELLSMMLLDPELFGTSGKVEREGEIDWEVGVREDFVDPELTALRNVFNQEQEELTTLETNLAKKEKEFEDNYAAAKKKTADAQAAHDAAKFPASIATGLALSTAKTEEAIAKGVYDTREVTLGPMRTAITVQEAVVAAADNAVQRWIERNNEKIGNLNDEKAGLYRYESDAEGWITLDDGVTKVQAPLSAKVNKDGVTIEKGVPMVVYLDAGRKTFTATYGDYDKAVFAAVADEAE